MKMNRKWLSIILVMIVLFSVPCSINAAKVKTYKHKKVTAKQIVTEMRKICPIKKIYKHKNQLSTGEVNSYKSKYSFYDKKYKKVYCSIEVFKDSYDASRRASYFDTLSVLYSTFDEKEDVPLAAFRYKNVLLRVPSNMSYKYMLKYYKALKKIVK